MDKPKVTPKDFFLWLGAMAALYSSVVAFLTLTFQYINTAYPDPLSYTYDPYSGSIRFAIATLIVAFPLFLVLMRIIRKDISAHAEKSDLWVRRWALYLTVFIAGLTVATDLVTLIYYFLDGEVTMRFALKVLMVFLVVGAGFLHFLADIWGYWIKYPQRAMYVGIAVAALLVATIASGFYIIGSPTDARLYKFDEQKVADLTNIQWQLINFYQQKERLPTALAELQDPISGFIVPLDPQTGVSYTYAADKLSFKLCATFNKESRPMLNTVTRPALVEPGVDGDITLSPWNHGVGEMCFDREIDPERYPPYTKGSPVVK
ncbi:MAG: hypothetical protein RLZZ283_490 [Candidatus Parcubacteria bacterium]|jgi:hypothetical protein